METAYIARVLAQRSQAQQEGFCSSQAAASTLVNELNSGLRRVLCRHIILMLPAFVRFKSAWFSGKVRRKEI